MSRERMLSARACESCASFDAALRRQQIRARRERRLPEIVERRRILGVREGAVDLEILRQRVGPDILPKRRLRLQQRHLRRGRVCSNCSFWSEIL